MATGIALLVSLAQIDVPTDTMCDIFGRLDRQTEMYRQRTQIHIEKQLELEETESRYDEQLREFEPQLQAALASRMGASALPNTANRAADAVRQTASEPVRQPALTQTHRST